MAGETKALEVAAAVVAMRVLPRATGPALQVVELLATYSATNQLEIGDVMEVAYLPPGVKVWMIGVTATDMDSSTGLVQKVVIGSTDVLTGLTNGQAATTTLHQLPAPYTTTTHEVLKLVNTTAASGTPATGSVKLRLYYTAP